MSQMISSAHWVDENGNPAGGETSGVGFEISWQNGPLMVDGIRTAPTGAFVEHVIEAAVDRIRFYNDGKFACRENSLAITKLEEALHWLHHRTADRVSREVEGTHQL